MVPFVFMGLFYECWLCLSATLSFSKQRSVLRVIVSGGYQADKSAVQTTLVMSTLMPHQRDGKIDELNGNSKDLLGLLHVPQFVNNAVVNLCRGPALHPWRRDRVYWKTSSSTQTAP
jgi:hypothetical protein